MKCLNCGSDQLFGVVTLRRVLKLAAKGGSVKVGGVKVSQVDLKDVWDKKGDGEPRMIRGPIMCAECNSEHYYVVGAKKTLRLGDYETAIHNGYDAVIAEEE